MGQVTGHRVVEGSESHKRRWDAALDKLIQKMREDNKRNAEWGQSLDKPCKGPVAMEA